MNFELREETPREQGRLARPDFARWRSPEGEVVATFHRVAEGFLVRFFDRADFLIALDDEAVTCWATPEASPNATRDLYLNQVMPIIRAHQGQLIVHASGVAIGSGAAAFVGATGRGKSTLAAAFARAGTPFLSDDGLQLVQKGEHYLAHPNHPSLRLCLDSEAEVVLGEVAPDEWDRPEKSRIEADESLPFQAEPLLLQALYFLGPGAAAQPTITGLSVREALAELMNHTFLLDVEDRDRMKRHFDALTRVAEAVPSFTFDYPREYARLPSVMAAVSMHMEDLGGASREAN